MNFLIITPCLAVYIICFYFYINSYSNHKPGRISESYSTQNVFDTCKLPKYDIWDKEYIQYYNPNADPTKNCKKVEKITILDDKGWRIHEKFQKNFSCKARCHRRKSDYDNLISDWMKEAGPVDCEVLETTCQKNDDKKNDVYAYLHTQIIKKENKTRLEQDKKRFNVFVILIDSLAYSQTIRSLPKTLSYFTENLNGIAFPYMNKVGENSRPNGVPLWFGKQLEEIDRRLFRKESIQPDWTHREFCGNFKDNDTSIFDEYRMYGYQTLLAEDWMYGTLNYPNCKGFDKPNIDHYMRPFQVAYEKRGTKLTRNHLKGCRERHHPILEYYQQFIDAYPDELKFGWAWMSTFSHNHPDELPHADKDLFEFFQKNENTFQNSFVFLMGDHGLRFGKVRSTKLGKIDVNNPLMAISIPRELRIATNLLGQMRENAKQLQTHYDTRATLLDILKHQPSSNYMSTSLIEIKNERGHSLFREQPSFPRTCKTLPIPFGYCLCQFETKQESNSSSLANDFGVLVANEVNKILKEGKVDGSCIEMVYSKAISIDYYVNNDKDRIYNVEVEMDKPSKARFKTIISVDEFQKMSIVAKIERTNTYGKTADCIKEGELRPYCHCPSKFSLRRLLFFL